MWLIPELINNKGTGTPIMESNPADVFAFVMVAVGVLTGKVPLHEEQNN